MMVLVINGRGSFCVSALAASIAIRRGWSHTALSLEPRLKEAEHQCNEPQTKPQRGVRAALSAAFDAEEVWKTRNARAPGGLGAWHTFNYAFCVGYLDFLWWALQ